jgi:antitoxin YefM
MEAISYTDARGHFASVLDRIESTREAVVIRRRGHEDVAMIPADELSSMMETAHVFRSPANAKRFLEALLRSYRGGGEEMDIDDLQKALGVPADHRS